ncbi:MAG: hypothetical protein PHQ60_16295 [Sideroxydans sp.]|nr:hypothetical protein [Sideroxydans sp.]
MADKKLMLMGLLLFMFLLCFNGVNAEFYEWRQEGGVNNEGDDVLNTGYPYYGLNYVEADYYALNITNESFELYLLPVTEFNPLIADMDENGINEIYVIEGEEIGVYSSYGENLATITPNSSGNITSISIFGEDKQLAVLTTDGGYGDNRNLLTYTLDSGVYFVNNYLNIPDYLLTFPVSVACDNEGCLVKSATTPKPPFFIWYNLSSSGKLSFYGSRVMDYYSAPYNAQAVSYTDMNDYYMISSETTGGSSFIINPSLLAEDPGDPSNVYPRIDFFYKSEFNDIFVSDTAYPERTEQGSYGNNTIYNNKAQVGYTRLGSFYNFFLLNFIFEKPGDYKYQIMNIYDLNGNILNEEVYIGGEAYISSNWVSADYNFDGWNEICHLYNDSGSIMFECYDENMDIIVEDDYTGIIPNINNIAIGVFDPNASTMGIATYEGIFYEDNVFYSTGKSGQVEGDVVIGINGYSTNFNVTPLYIYTDDVAGHSFVVRTNATEYAYYCGDGVCQEWLGENLITCFEDCQPTAPEEEEEPPEEGELPEGWKCTTDADCEYGLTCEYGVCSPSGHGEECDDDDDCISGDCVGGYCSKPSTWDLMDASKNQQFGDDTNTNNFIALGIMIALAGMLGFYAGIWVGIASFFMSAIFFVMVGWLSGFILIGLLIVGVIALFFSFMAHSSGGQ